MGNKDSKVGAIFNFKQYGLSTKSAEGLQKYFQTFAGTDHLLDLNEFQKLYIDLDGDVGAEEAKKAFIAADSNKDNFITLDEFTAFYIIKKSQPGNINRNLSLFLKQLNGNSEVITTQQAKTYMKFVISDELSTHMIEKLTINYGDEIPISDFVENASIFSDMIYNNS
jgi:Ca2+-binding EF-hand superfamily protein